MAKFHLVLLIHAHQPVGNFDEVIEQAYAQSYRPFLEVLERHPKVRMGFHCSGCLLEWIERKHPEYFELIRELVGRRQLELLGGGFYEPILISIPPADRVEQLRRLSNYVEKHFGEPPSGAWLAERVWEPQLPATFAEAGVEYTLVDDVHFLSTGLEESELLGYYITDELGMSVKVIPGLKALRYFIPFREVEETIRFLRSAAQQRPGGLAAMGDDCEKFGVWPETHNHCYRDGWLDRFFAAVEANSDWLEATTPGAYAAAHPALGRIALPSASYTEMMQWALPSKARLRLSALENEFASRPDVLPFLRGTTWRNFLKKYSEANLLYRKMLHVSRQLECLAARKRQGRVFRRNFEEAKTNLLRAQCNDSYWHGIFGGLYAPHLRTAAWCELARAEKLAGAAEHRHHPYTELEQLDFDSDGREELYLTSNRYAALVKPSDGGTIATLDFLSAEASLINSIERRPEAYHARLNQMTKAASVASIHEQVRAKEPGLERILRYDRWARHSFRLLVFASGKSHEDYAALRLEEDAGCAGGAFRVASASPTKVELEREGSLEAHVSHQSRFGQLRVRKTFAFRPATRGFDVECFVALEGESVSPRLQLQVGLELVLNFLAPNQPDRYFEAASTRYPLNWGGLLPASALRVADEWQKVAAVIEAPEAQAFWVAPIETVSESEEGFERVYQGSQILPVWPAQLGLGKSWSARVVLRVSSLK